MRYIKVLAIICVVFSVLVQPSKTEAAAAGAGGESTVLPFRREEAPSDDSPAPLPSPKPVQQPQIDTPRECLVECLSSCPSNKRKPKKRKCVKRCAKFCDGANN
jgi:hypothetical protein